MPLQTHCIRLFKSVYCQTDLIGFVANIIFITPQRPRNNFFKKAGFSVLGSEKGNFPNNFIKNGGNSSEAKMWTFITQMGTRNQLQYKIPYKITLNGESLIFALLTNAGKCSQSPSHMNLCIV
jgi:hypothetical protein